VSSATASHGVSYFGLNYLDSSLTMDFSADHELIVRQKPLNAKVFIGKEKGKSAHGMITLEYVLTVMQIANQ
jgi:hypothetical protein